MNDTAVNSFKEHGFSALISLDGTGCKHDASRPYKTGGGSFSDIDKNVRRFSESFPFGARATLTNNNCNLVEDYLQFKEMGFRRIYFSPVSSFDENIKLDEHSLNKIRAGLIDLADQYLKQIDQGEKPLFRTLKTAVDLIMSNRIAFVGCGAGRRFISVTPEGDVYPCHRFVGMMRFKMGNIVTGIDETRYIENWSQGVEKRIDCTDCWARSFCGGGCSWEAADEHGYLPKSLHPASCEYRKMCYEMAFDLISP